jgi:hypothetical protein
MVAATGCWCHRTRFHVLLIEVQASDMGLRCDRDVHAGAAAELGGLLVQRPGRRQWHEQQLAAGPRPASDALAQWLQRGLQRMRWQLAHHYHAQPAVRQQHPRHLGALPAVGIDAGRVHPQHLAVGSG